MLSNCLRWLVPSPAASLQRQLHFHPSVADHNLFVIRRCFDLTLHEICLVEGTSAPETSRFLHGCLSTGHVIGPIQCDRYQGLSLPLYSSM